MFAQMIEQLFRSLDASDITEGTIILILVIFSYAVICARKDGHYKFVVNAPNLMTSIGILGTFIGIVIGLREFNSAEIEKSISSLLEGLKTAFITSVVGMTFSILFKTLDAWGLRKQDNMKSLDHEPTSTDIYKLLSEQKEIQESIKSGITGGEDASLVSQIRLLRTDFNDYVKKSEKINLEFEERLFTELKNFAEMMAKSATEQVINALKQVISDFNKNLTEQFGENFKQLNSAVEKLVTWQRQYMEQLEQTIKQLALATEGVTQIEKSTQSIATSAEAIPNAIAQLSKILQTNQNQIDEISRHLEAFATLKDRAVQAIPKTQETIDLMLREMTNSQASLQKSFSLNIAAAKSALESLETGSTQVHTSMIKMTDGYEQNATRLVNEVMNSVRTKVESGLQGVSDQIQEAVKKTGESVNIQTKQLDQALQQELNTAMRGLGSALATIVSHMGDVYASKTGVKLNG